MNRRMVGYEPTDLNHLSTLQLNARQIGRIICVDHARPRRFDRIGGRIKFGNQVFDQIKDVGLAVAPRLSARAAPFKARRSDGDLRISDREQVDSKSLKLSEGLGAL